MTWMLSFPTNTRVELRPPERQDDGSPNHGRGSSEDWQMEACDDAR